MIKNNTFPGGETIILPISLALSDDFLPLDLFTKPLRDIGKFWNAIKIIGVLIDIDLILIRALFLKIF